MKKTNIFKIFLVVLCVLFLTSCVKKIEKEDNIVDTFEEFKTVVSEKPENVTYEMKYSMIISFGGKKETAEVDINVKLDDNKALVDGVIDEEAGKAYAELVGGKYHAWSYTDGEWSEEDIITKEEFESSLSYPMIEVKEGDFEYKDGKWIADNEKIKSAVIDALGNSEFSDSDIELNIEVKNYVITIKDNHISNLSMEFSFIVGEGAYSYGFEYVYEISFKDYGTTKVEKPSALTK